MLINVNIQCKLCHAYEFKYPSCLGIQSVPSAAAVLGSAAQSKCLPAQTRQQSEGRKLDRLERKQKLDWGSGVQGARRTQSMLCNTKGAKTKRQAEWSQITTVVKLLTTYYFGPRWRLQHLANVCKFLKSMLCHPLFCPPQSLTMTVYVPCAHEAYFAYTSTFLKYKLLWLVHGYYHDASFSYQEW